MVSYVEIAKEAGVNLKPMLQGKVHVYFSDLQSEMGKSTILGIARGSANDNEVHVEIDRANWEKMTELQRTTTMYHELSHDILNAAHVDDEMDLMHPTYQYKSIAALVIGMTRVFKKYKNGTLIKFEKK